MSKNDITTKGLLTSYTDMGNLIRALASNPTFKGEAKKYKEISSQKFGGLNTGTHRILKLTNKSCNFRNLKEEK